MPTYEGLRLRLRNMLLPKIAPRRRKQLKHDAFTIISNNCWGGTVYESYGLQKQSPTVGLFFMADDYIRFLRRLEEYLQAELTFIRPMDSRWKDAPQVSGDRRFGSYPVGVLSLDDESVEIFFLHYHSAEEALDKWTRRCRRIRRDRLIVKFNDQNGCTHAHIAAFCALSFPRKLFFTAQDWPDADRFARSLDGAYFRIRQHADGPVLASYEPVGKARTLNVTEYINLL